MRKLLIIRHGKSLRGPEYTTDFERPLAQRGIKAAKRMARWLIEHGHEPTLIVTSPALRAKQTAELISHELLELPLWEDATIYEADVDDLISVVRGLPDEDQVVLLVGHNFGLEYFVDELTGAQDTVLKTCSLAALSCEIESWGRIVSGCCQLSSLVHPRELAD